MAFDLEKRKIYSSESRQSTSGDACIQLSIYRLKPAVNYAIGELHRCHVYHQEYIYFPEKWFHLQP